MSGHTRRIQSAARRIGVVDVCADIQTVIQTIRGADIRIRRIDRVCIAIVALNRNAVHRRANNRTADRTGIGCAASGCAVAGAAVAGATIAGCTAASGCAALCGAHIGFGNISGRTIDRNNVPIVRLPDDLQRLSASETVHKATARPRLRTYIDIRRRI